MTAETNSPVTAMYGTAICKRIFNSTAGLVKDSRGNIAPIFAIAILPMLGFVGAAVDYTRANAARSSMQAALDSASLMVSKDVAASPNMTAAQITTAAQNYFNALYHNKDALGVTVSATYTPYSSGTPATVLVSGSGTVKTDFMKVAGIPQINFNSNSTTTWGNTKLRVALALDNTGSMADDGKITALQSSAKSLIDQLSATAQNSDDVYISIVPFAKDVNLGSSNYTQNWIDWTDWESNNPNYGKCSKASYTTKSTCLFYGKTWTPDHSKWTGCVTDRTQPYDAQSTTPNTAITATLFPAEEYYENSEYYCKTGNSPYLQPVVPLSNDFTSLKNTISAMVPTGGTNQPIGLAWAWQTLLQATPMNAPAENSNYSYTRAIILLSDGLNTEDRWPSYGNGNTQFGGQIDARQQILCNNIKAAVDSKGKPMYTVYTIQVNTSRPADPTSTVLQNCASDSSKFFMLTSSTQILTAFNSIGASLSKLRIAK